MSIQDRNRFTEAIGQQYFNNLQEKTRTESILRFEEECVGRRVIVLQQLHNKKLGYAEVYFLPSFCIRRILFYVTDIVSEMKFGSKSARAGGENLLSVEELGHQNIEFYKKEIPKLLDAVLVNE